MANELKYAARSLTGQALYAVLLNAAGQVWNGSAFVSLSSGDWAQYDIALTEQQSLGIWYGNFPVVAAGVYSVQVYQQAGGSPATTDTQVGQGAVDWDGTAERSLGSVKLTSDGFDPVLLESSISAGAGLVNDSGTQLTSINARQGLAAILSACGAVLAGAATSNVTIRPAGKPASSPRIDATVDDSGNRNAVNLKVPD